MQNKGCLIINVIITYGRNRKSARKILWQEFKDLRARIGNEVWTIMGDLNEIRDWTERKGEGDYGVDGAKKFNDMIEDIETIELPKRTFHMD